MTRQIHVLGRRVVLPESKTGRRAVGVLLIVGGVLGFLPVLGFWMLPLGVVVLSVDSPLVLRFRRRITVRFARYFKR